MSTMWCPDCGAEYRDGVTTCSDCDVALASTPPADGNRADDDHTEVVVYELGDWSGDQRGALELRLQAEGIDHSWEQGEGREALVGYENAQVWELATDVVVGEQDEQRVDDILDEIENPDALEAVTEAQDGEVDDEADYQVMSHLYVAADRLKDDPADLALAGEFFDAADAAKNVALPFGFDPDVWAKVKELATGIASDLEQEAADDVVGARAKELRDILFDFV